MGIIGGRVKDPRFMELIRKTLKAGYMEFPKYTHSVVGTLQGSIISPILCNIYMNEFDKYIEGLEKEFNIGTKASRNPEWVSCQNKKLALVAKTLEDKLK